MSSDWLYGYLGIKEIPFVPKDNKKNQQQRAIALWTKFTSRKPTPLLVQVMDILRDDFCVVVYQEEFRPVVRSWTSDYMVRDWRERTAQLCKEPYRRLGYGSA